MVIGKFHLQASYNFDCARRQNDGISTIIIRLFRWMDQWTDGFFEWSLGLRCRYWCLYTCVDVGKKLLKHKLRSLLVVVVVVVVHDGINYIADYNSLRVGVGWMDVGWMDVGCLSPGKFHNWITFERLKILG